jgi:glycopeptide antibiotics resistance protein
MGVLPWFLPGVVVSIVVGAALSRALARRLDIGRPLAWVIIVAVGIILAATLTPLRGSINFDATSTGCDLSRIGPAPLRVLLRFDDESLNVALFIPLGIAIGVVPRLGPRIGLIAAAAALPFAIEYIQLVAPALDRGCQSGDVVDNLSGLVIGLVIGAGLRVFEDQIRSWRETAP